MAPTFRLATVLRLRERERDQAAQDLDQVHRAIAIIDERTQEIQREHRRMDDERQQASQGAIAVHRLLDAQRYQLILVGQLQHISQQRQQLLQEQERREKVLVTKQQAVKTLEKLKQKHQEEEMHIQQLRQQSRIDEWSVLREARNRNG